MKTTTATFVMTFAVTMTFGQITTTKLAKNPDAPKNIPYDSTKNILGERDVYKYVGQELYVNQMAKSLREYGFEGFSLDYKEPTLLNAPNVYKCCDSYNSKYDSLAGKYFKVLEVFRHPQAEESKGLYGYTFFLKLLEKLNGDTVYYAYDTRFEHQFPFIVVGFFEKLKKLYIGKEFVFSSKVVVGRDIKSGNVIIGQTWKCVDVTINEDYYTLSLVIQNSLGEKQMLSYDTFLSQKDYLRVYTAKEADLYRTKFGTEKFQQILQGKVLLGFTEEMCKLSWGNPKKNNKTITAGKVSEQWVYGDNNLYFDNDILTVIQ